MSGPSLDDLASVFTQARDNADGCATGTHAGCAAVARELIRHLLPEPPQQGPRPSFFPFSRRERAQILQRYGGGST